MLWSLSYRELFRRLLVSVEERVERHNRDVRLAWLAEYFARAKRPDAKKFLIGGEPEQTFEEQLEVVKRMSKVLGGEIKTVHRHG